MPLWSVTSLRAVRLPSGRQCATILIQVQERDLSWYRKHHPRAPRDGEGAPRRAELADFLRTRREAVRPEDVGLPGGGRRRTRACAARRSRARRGGYTWYTWLEQGRDVRASASVLEAIAGRSSSTPAEHAHVMLLGRGRGGRAGQGPEGDGQPTIRRLVENLDPNPGLHHRSPLRHPGLEPTPTRRVFGDPAEMPDGVATCSGASSRTRPRKLHPDWEEGARRIVARFRGEAARYVGDPDFEDLISALQERSPE